MATFNNVFVATYEHLKKKFILMGAPNLLDIARGKIAFARQAQVEGYIETIVNRTRDVSELDVDIIPAPALSGVSMQIVSTSINDTIAGLNSRKVTIEYIEPVTEILTQVEVDLNGTTPVNVPVSIAFVSDFYVSNSANLDAVSDGDITIFNGATVYNIIKTGGNKSLQLYRYVPKNRDFYITSMTSSGSSKTVTIRLRANQSDNLTTTTGFIFRTVQVSADGSTEITFKPPIVITGGHYLKASVFSTSADNNGVVSVALNGWLENKNPRTLNMQA